MKEPEAYERDLASIREMMERSVKFLSLSGLAGILAGLYGLAGATVGYYLMYYPKGPAGLTIAHADEAEAVKNLVVTAIVVLALSLSTGYLLSLRNARKLGVPIWNQTSRRLLTDLFTPLLTGGLLIGIFLQRGSFTMIASSCLVFYGLALLQASRHTFEEVRYLGLTEIGLGLLAAMLPEYGLVLWAIGFGGMHIVYGSLMYFRHER